jgi:hypothetical protein
VKRLYCTGMSRTYLKLSCVGESKNSGRSVACSAMCRSRTICKARRRHASSNTESNRAAVTTVHCARAIKASAVINGRRVGSAGADAPPKRLSKKPLAALGPAGSCPEVAGAGAEAAALLESSEPRMFILWRWPETKTLLESSVSAAGAPRYASTASTEKLPRHLWGPASWAFLSLPQKSHVEYPEVR